MRKALAIFGMTALLVIAAQPALGISWGPESTYYKGIKRATGEGDFRNDGNVRAHNKITVKDDAGKDGNNVYGVTEFYFLAHGCEMDFNPNGSGEKCYEDYRSAGRKKTEEISDRTRTFDHKWNLAPNGKRARAETFACVQMGWPVPDGCAAAAYPGFEY